MISDLFQSSVNTGTVPTDWREAIVTPIFKKGAKSKPENYRLDGPPYRRLWKNP
jgi:hypothetical protein